MEEKVKKKTWEGIAQRKTHQHISIGIYTHTYGHKTHINTDAYLHIYTL